ncbi:MAG: sigma-70 family RNA polymerase sigma factor [Candidatus Limnocylindrales bacterium]
MHEDRALADAVLGGDREAFRVLVEREAASVLGACRRVLGDAADAEDAAQEAFLIAYRKLGAYRGDGPLGGWLMRIAIREARDRALRRRPTTSLTNDDDLPLSVPGLTAAATEGPEASVESGERSKRIHAALADLPEHYRDAVRLRYLDELSFQEISAATGRPEPTVRTHVHRGLARLRASLVDERQP